jgi:uncharacterized Tic20 family protein
MSEPTPPPADPPYGSPEQPPHGSSAQPPYGSPAEPPYGSPAQPPYAQPAAAGAPLSDADTRQWAGLAHLGGILFWPPSLIIWLVYKDRSAFVEQEAKKALNFQLTLLIIGVALTVLDWVLPWGIVGFGRLALWIVSLIFSIQGFQAVQRGQAYRYPFGLQLIK